MIPGSCVHEASLLAKAENKRQTIRRKGKDRQRHGRSAMFLLMEQLEKIIMTIIPALECNKSCS